MNFRGCGGHVTLMESKILDALQINPQKHKYNMEILNPSSIPQSHLEKKNQYETPCILKQTYFHSPTVYISWQ